MSAQMNLLLLLLLVSPAPVLTAHYCHHQRLLWMLSQLQKCDPCCRQQV
jgi:hypothetical protein